MSQDEPQLVTGTINYETDTASHQKLQLLLKLLSNNTNGVYLSEGYVNHIIWSLLATYNEYGYRRIIELEETESLVDATLLVSHDLMCKVNLNIPLSDDDDEPINKNYKMILGQLDTEYRKLWFLNAIYIVAADKYIKDASDETLSKSKREKTLKKATHLYNAGKAGDLSFTALVKSNLRPITLEMFGANQPKLYIEGDLFVVAYL